jgi:hypothetical protein
MLFFDSRIILRRLGPLLTKLSLSLLAMALVSWPAAEAGDRLALWAVVHDECVPEFRSGGLKRPCISVDLSSSEDNGVAIVKDQRGVATNARHFPHDISLVSKTVRFLRTRSRITSLQRGRQGDLCSNS